MSGVKRDEDGEVIVTVKDILEYLQQFPADMRVVLDKDGWMEDENDYEDDISKLIHYRGIFQRFENTLFINN